jgi:hypothetical protein
MYEGLPHTGLGAGLLTVAALLGAGFTAAGTWLIRRFSRQPS